ncbi:hypothetical protein [Streptomyces exfoliatus]|uniref:hypothetical protein n=1 Tax=Streptomyces exfoliatus TaxID=1905 RepID=UPI00046458B1|nr:hypothetical protein [Streptomyces exfoliatus]
MTCRCGWRSWRSRPGARTRPAATLDALTATYGLDPAEALPVCAAARPGATPSALLDAVATDWLYRMPAFAKTGNPGRQSYEPVTRTTMDFTMPGPAEVIDPRAHEPRLWDGVR